MKRLLMIISIAALAVTGVVPAANAHHERPLEDSGLPVAMVCKGTGGYTDAVGGPRWSFDADSLDLDEQVGARPDYGCTAVSPHSIGYHTTTPSPDPFGLVFWAGTQGVSPVGIMGDLALKGGTGDFTCGNGSLSGNGHHITYWHSVINPTIWNVQQWEATLTDGVGEISGTAREWFTDDDRNFSGTIAIDDGAAAGDCDDSAGNSQVVIAIVIE